MADVPWSGGPPTPGELENYLVTVRGLEREQARRLSNAYIQTRGGWTQETLSEWINDMIPTVEAQGDPVDRDFTAVTELASEMAAEDRRYSERGRALAEERSQAIASQVQSIYDNARVTSDAGGFDPNAAAQSLAVGVVTDAAGNPVLDPDTNEPIPFDANQLWNQVRGMAFNMGNLSLPYTQDIYGGMGPGAKRPRSIRDRSIRGVEGDVESERNRNRSRNAQAARYARNPNARFRGPSERPPSTRMTPSQALAMLGSMSEDQLTALQQQMWEAGLYEVIELGGQGVMPSWGVADAATRQALIALFVNAAQRDPGMPISRILTDMAAERVQRMGPPESGPGAPGAQELVEIPDFQPSVLSAETLSALVDETAQQMLGEFVPEDRKQAIIQALQEKEIGLQRQEYLYSVQNIREQAQAQFALGGGGQGGGAGAGEIDRFMNAIAGLESGGDYDITSPVGAYGKFQIMPSNWAPWATRAGLGPNAPRTPQNQEIVARRIMLDYYAEFGNWRDVAVAWFAGPDNVRRRDYSGGDINMSIREYADNIMNRFGQLAQGDPMAQSGLVEVGGSNLPPIARFDPQAEAEAIIKAQDPVGWEAHEFADRAIEFYNLLGGVV